MRRQYILSRGINTSCLEPTRLHRKRDSMKNIKVPLHGCVLRRHSSLLLSYEYE